MYVSVPQPGKSNIESIFLQNFLFDLYLNRQFSTLFFNKITHRLILKYYNYTVLGYKRYIVHEEYTGLDSQMNEDSLKQS